MALDRWLALGILGICCVYGYAAWFTMDDNLPRFMQRNPVWPSTFPKALAVIGAATALWIVVFQAPMDEPKEDDIDYRRLASYKIGQAAALIGLMLAYAFLLRPMGFLGSTLLFLCVGGFILGERRFWLMIPVGAVAAGGIWYLVSEVLGIFMRPLPLFLS